MNQLTLPRNVQSLISIEEKATQTMNDGKEVGRISVSLINMYLSEREGIPFLSFPFLAIRTK